MPDQPAPDFEEARRIAEAVADRNRQVPYSSVVVIAYAVKSLLSEREAREEVIEAAREIAASLRLACSRSGQLEATLTAWGVPLNRLIAALPATESAQADRAGNIEHHHREMDMARELVESPGEAEL